MSDWDTSALVKLSVAKQTSRNFKGRVANAIEAHADGERREARHGYFLSAGSVQKWALHNTFDWKAVGLRAMLTL